MNKHRIGALIAAAALTLTFAGTALATDHPWAGNGYPQQSCNGSPETALWVWTGDSPTSLTINGNVQSGSWSQNGQGSWHFTVTLGAGNFPPTSASVEYTGGSGVLTLSHCDGTVTTTTTSEVTTTTSESTTTSDETTTTSEETTTTEVTTTSEETTTTSTTTAPTGTLFAFPAFALECGGSITVTNFASAQVDDALITGPGDDVIIDADGNYPLVPGDYIGVGRVGGEAVTDEVPFTIEACPTTTTTSAEETTPGGSVEELTPPSTDTIGAPTSGSTVSTSLLLVLAGALASALVVIPAAARKRR
jgi:hypothetical protein